jgi:hypothetical protein
MSQPIAYFPGTMASTVRALRDIRLPGFDNPEAKVVYGSVGEVLSLSPRPTEPGHDGMDTAMLVVAFDPGSVPLYSDAAGPVVTCPVSWLEPVQP